MDSVLVIGGLDTKLKAFFEKIGYKLFFASETNSAPAIIRQNIIDLAIIDATTDKLGHEYIQFLKSTEGTRDIPLVVLSPDKLQTLQIKELNYDKVSVIQAPFSLGTVASNIATSLRLRKMSGKNADRASVSEINASLRDMNERHAKELAEAQAIQNSLLPKTLPQNDKFEIAAIYQPLEEVGGDFYAVDELGENLLRFISADVTGHGLPAAFIGSMTKLALVAVNKSDPGELLAGMNSLIAPIIPQGRFVTANAYTFNYESGELFFARAGGPQALLISSDRQKFEEIKGDGFPLGFFEEGEYPSGTIAMQTGDTFVVVTDGITEAQNRDSQFFGFEGIVNAVKKTVAGDSPDKIIQTILSDFNNFIDGRLLKDDVTVLVLVRR
jgi:serine phosphatase RsbU (regulator of sigma subunit)